jgi:hypothetical protein
VYDDAGRMVASHAEPEWDPEQYALVAALADVETDECSQCGHPMSESMSPDSDPDRQDATHKYVALPAHRCHACTAREQQAESYKDSPHRHALRFPVVREERPARR